MRPTRYFVVIVVLGIGLFGRNTAQGADQPPTINDGSSTTTTQQSVKGKTAHAFKVTTLKSIGAKEPPREAVPNSPPPISIANQKTQPFAKPKAPQVKPSKSKTRHQAQNQTQPSAAAVSTSKSEAAAASSPPASNSNSSGPITIEGLISSIDLRSTTPNLQLTMPSGKVWTLTIDTANTVVRKGDQTGKMQDIEAGHSARVSYALKEGKSVVTVITDLETFTQQAPAPTEPATPSP